MTDEFLSGNDVDGELGLAVAEPSSLPIPTDCYHTETASALFHHSPTGKRRREGEREEHLSLENGYRGSARRILI